MSASPHPFPAALLRRSDRDRPWTDRTLASLDGGVARRHGARDRQRGRARAALRRPRRRLAAHQISTATFLALFAAYFPALERRWPIATTRRALQIGATWVVLTVGFEFGFGRWVDGKSWSELARDYDITSGRLPCWCSCGSGSAPRWCGGCARRAVSRALVMQAEPDLVAA
ncbi:MAG TPA: hypothetical protein VHF51_13930 [Solirubrobacteraceae bacterium]|nr:hypothetical protein [Solirubrobacteraceae bacterium]